MAGIIKHVGRHNNRKIAIIYKTVPDEDHMALVVYTDAMPALLHDETMKVLESAVGQNEKELADALFRHIMADGRNCLEALHRSGQIKKVQTSQVIVTVSANSSIRLDELNGILKQMAQGDEATKKLAELDANRGIKGARVPAPRELGEPALPPVIDTPSVGVLSDVDLAKQRIEQASRLRLDADTLLAEAKRLEQEAKSLAPKKTNVRTSKKTTA